jgi:hypothetical protein
LATGDVAEAQKLLAEVRAKARPEHYPAPYAVIDLWTKYGARSDAAYEAEARSISGLMVGETSRNLVRVFALQERLKNLGGKKSTARTAEQTEMMINATNALRDYFAAEIAERRRAPRDDLISDILAAQERGTELSDEEIRVHCIGFLVAGNMTTSDLIGNGILALLQHPAELAKLKAKPELVGKAIEEILRYAPPVGQSARIANREMAAGGCPVHKGQVMITSIPGANRDPAAYAEPDRFDLTREAQPHVSFGGGQHICIGAPLARLEAQVAFAKLFQRYPNLKLVQEEVRWKATPFFHGLEELRVRA